MTKQIILVDGHSYVYRSWYAISNMSVRGFATNAIYGFSSLLLKLAMQLTRSEHVSVVFVFDPPGKKFRHDLFPTYKANRPPMPEALELQLTVIYDLVRAFGFHLEKIAGVEADDVIGTLTKRALEEKYQVRIASIDKDFTQLINESVYLCNLQDDTEMDVDKVKKRFGVLPNQMVDYLSLLGDSADNIPGVPGVGPKTASKWLSLFGSLDTILQRIHEIPNKISLQVIAMREQLLLNRTLITIRQDIPLSEHVAVLSNLYWAGPDYKEVEKIYRTYELASHHSRLRDVHDMRNRKNLIHLPLFNQEQDVPKGTIPTAPSLPDGYTVISSIDRLKILIENMQRESLVAVDCETTSLQFVEAKIVGMSFSFQEGAGYYVPLLHRDVSGTLIADQCDMSQALALLKPWLESDLYRKCGHNLKYDRNVLLASGISLRGIVDDSLLQAHITLSQNNGNSLDALSRAHLNLPMLDFETLTKTYDAKENFSLVPIVPAAGYAIADADYSLRLNRHFTKTIHTHHSERLYRDIELPLLTLLSDIETRGVMIDIGILNQLSKDFKAEVSQLEETIATLAGKKINLASPKQVAELLYDNLKCPILGKTPQGAPSTAEYVLDLLANPPHSVAIAKHMLQHRMYAKLLNTYTEPLPNLVSSITGRIHTSYHQAATSTGRLSSTNPNLQNIPIGTSEGAKIRSAFIAQPGWSLISADYSQIELRVMAHLSQDETMVKAFEQNIDIHQTTASEIFATPLDQVTPEQRRSAKAINFGLIYGMGAFGLASRLGIERDQATQYIDTYFGRFPKVRQYMEQCKLLAKKEGYVTTMMGRVVLLPSINSKNYRERSHHERVAINAPVQGSAAEVLKIAMLSLAKAPIILNKQAHIIMQVHDELVLEVNNEYISQALEEVSMHMKNAIQLDVPLEVSIHSAANWNDAH
ncbi:MAG: DNA polymerase I [Methylacidiphilales bacterium]|nr:DNA polymerase I [Candidatus Methylacidiphilales bacterium]